MTSYFKAVASDKGHESGYVLGFGTGDDGKDYALVQAKELPEGKRAELGTPELDIKFVCDILNRYCNGQLKPVFGGQPKPQKEAMSLAEEQLDKVFVSESEKEEK